ncbi:GNAT family N-acetyltransferase [Streptomyces sp. NPDC057877]|uniref:GNAT family N-acetyltransferase n=1 Tax=Streptomyces sp. NPDC057877 TaxID=3346269 RepID=UPI0036C0D2F8
MNDTRIDVRPITEDEIPAWIRAAKVGFLKAPVVTDEEVAERRAHIDPARTLAAFDGDRCVATFRSYAQKLTAVGGRTVPADGITGVTVTATHRRRGLLTRMMRRDLAAARERGDVVATLIAAEYPIYGRYGFGPATTAAEWTVDVLRTGLDRRRAAEPEGGGRVELVDGDYVRKIGPELHERMRRLRHGAIDRDERWWQVSTGAIQHNGTGTWTEPFYAVYRAPGGAVEGLVTYGADDTWGDSKQPLNTATVRWLDAVSPAAERALWRFLCSIDWVARVRSGWRAPDDLLPMLLPDPRAAQLTTQADWLWVRVLDVARALEARSYAGPGVLVLDVVDPDGLAGGRYRLEVEGEGERVRCTAADGQDADLTLGVGELGSLWLGDESVARLMALGRVREERAGAGRVADALLRTSRRPWCPDMF